MAIIVPHRPRYRDRSLPIYYLSNGQMVLRQRPREVHDPRTQAQLYQRLRMRVASHFLSSFKSIVSLGFAPWEQDNFRMVGGYQQALGQLMREGLAQEPGGVRICTERVQLSSGGDKPHAVAQGSGTAREIAPDLERRAAEALRNATGRRMESG